MLIHGNSYFIYFYSWSCTLKNKFLSSIFSVAINQTLLNINLKVWEFTCQCKRHKKLRFNPWVRKISWSKKWQPTPVFLPGKFHGQKDLAGYSPRGCKELDTIEHTHTHTHTHTQSSRVLYLKIMNMEYFPLENNVDFLQLPVKVSKDVSYFVI